MARLCVDIKTNFFRSGSLQRGIDKFCNKYHVRSKINVCDGGLIKRQFTYLFEGDEAPLVMLLRGIEIFLGVEPYYVWVDRNNKLPKKCIAQLSEEQKP